MMQLESLPNDLLLDLFDYFDLVHLLRVFAGLNSRFHTLLFKHFRGYHVHFQHMSKCDFDMLCQRYLSSIADRIVSCCLINEEETPGLLDLFHSRGFHLNQFCRLKSLTLRNIHDQNIADMLDGVVHLVDLNISYCALSREQDNASCLINNRPKLRHCKLHNNYVRGSYFSGNTDAAATLEHLTIQCTSQPLTSEDLVYLFLSTPRLRVLSLHIELVNEIEHQRRPVRQTSVSTLKLTYQGEAYPLGKLLQSMPNLSKLTINLVSIKLNGHEWETLISTHASQLRTLRFKMSISSLNHRLSDQDIDALLDTFRTPFWLHEHHWYVRCDVEHRCLYTVPYAFDFFTTRGVGLSLIANTAESTRPPKGTYPNDSKYWVFNRVRRFDCVIQAKNASYLYPACFPNVEKLELRIPSHETIWRALSTLDRLITLHINLHEDMESNLQDLLDRAPHLYTLTVNFFLRPRNLLAVFRLRSASIRRLRLIPYAPSPWQYFDDAHCTTVATSPLAQQCEVLEIRVLSRDSILNLVSSMDRLRAMTVHVKDGERAQPPQSTETELIEWVQRHLSPTCLVRSGSRVENAFVIKLWLG